MSYRFAALLAASLGAACPADEPAPAKTGPDRPPAGANAGPAKAAVATATSPLTPSEAADGLSEEELAQLLDLLRNNYVQADALTESALARAGAHGLLERLGAGARVFPKMPEVTSVNSPLKSEIIDETVGYLRLGSMGDLGGLEASLDQFASKAVRAAVLDLRATPYSADFELAAEVCRRFVPKGRILFSVKRPKVNDEEVLTSRENPRWRGLLVILVDPDTAGAAEVVAAVLRTHLRAFVIGQQTKGEAAQFEFLPLGSGKFLRVAVGEVSLPDSSPVFPGGLRPDLVLQISQEKTDELLTAALTDGVVPVTRESQRPRMNEAALIAGTNPELDAAQERQKQKEQGVVLKAPLKDEALVRALDHITAIRIYEEARSKGR